LVGPDIEFGKTVVDALKGRGIDVLVAMWAQLADYGDWRLVLSARAFDGVGSIEAYTRLDQALTSAGVVRTAYQTIHLVPTTEPFVKDLRRVFGKTKSAEGMRLGGQSFGGKFIEDAYVYRIR